MTTDPTPTLAELEERVRGGDTTITAQQLAEARESEHLASLRQDAENRAQAAAQAEEHRAAVTQLHKDYAKLQGELAKPARKAYADLVAAAKKLHDTLAEFEPKRRAVVGQAMTLGVVAQCEDLFRIPAQSADTYLRHAANEASGAYWATGNGATPHALHSDDVVAEYEIRRQEALDAQAEREATAMANAETTIDHGWGNYTRRVEV
ncbi:hypothetical protein [Gordonia sp. SCSIO 19800]|uniref:hypothetical protein n=1 Tax=Gordonia sp. SCSIO 19800 TaxID=2826926 RepID=UPI001B816509|nr:hypothetical protein [Gordonia sp. SCSIO 19800]MBR7191914.1 hypothetical protein [Gordonia sp. SCSIO 19800]